MQYLLHYKSMFLMHHLVYYELVNQEIYWHTWVVNLLECWSIQQFLRGWHSFTAFSTSIQIDAWITGLLWDCQLIFLLPLELPQWNFWCIQRWEFWEIVRNTEQQQWCSPNHLFPTHLTSVIHPRHEGAAHGWVLLKFYWESQKTFYLASKHLILDQLYSPEKELISIVTIQDRCVWK